MVKTAVSVTAILYSATDEGHHGLRLHVHVQVGLYMSVQKGLATATLAGHSVQVRECLHSKQWITRSLSTKVGISSQGFVSDSAHAKKGA